MENPDNLDGRAALSRGGRYEADQPSEPTTTTADWLEKRDARLLAPWKSALRELLADHDRDDARGECDTCHAARALLREGEAGK